MARFGLNPFMAAALVAALSISPALAAEAPSGRKPGRIVLREER